MKGIKDVCVKCGVANKARMVKRGLHFYLQAHCAKCRAKQEDTDNE